MSHRSRLYAAYVDVPHPDYEASVRFYGELLGKPAEVDPDEPGYAWYGVDNPGIQLGVQSVGNDEPRVHLDIETDDIEAEVARLVGLGATVVERIQGWVVMNDPVGTVFCVIRVQDAEIFATTARSWS